MSGGGTTRLRRCTVAVSAVHLALALGSCGVKAPPLPPQFVRPQTIEDLKATPTPQGIRLTWSRPTTTVDGRAMKDLDGVIITRAEGITDGESTTDSAGGEVFEHIATIHLDDEGRFNKVRTMTFVDTTVTAGTVYLYRISAFTLDGYVGAPSSAVRTRWRGPRRASREKNAR